MDNSRAVMRIHGILKKQTPLPQALGEKVRQFMANCRSMSTAETYFGDLRRFLVFTSVCYPKAGIVNVDRKIILAFKLFLQHYGGKEKTGVGPAVINRHLAAISKFYDFLAEEQGFENLRNPVDKVERMSVPKDVKTRRVSSEKIKEILSMTSGKTFSDSLHQVILYLSFGTGLRNNEIRKLRIKDFKVDLGVGKLMIHSTKGNKYFVKKLPNAVTEALINYFDHCVVNGLDLNPKEYILRPKNDQTRGRPKLKGQLSYSTFSYVFKKYGKKVGIDDLNPHMARVSFITTLLKAGNLISEVKEEAGHTDVEMTLRYCKLLDDEKRDMRSDLDYFG